jgi:hypothetical protein
MTVANTDRMFAFVFLIGLLAICVLAGFYGGDLRHDKPDRYHPTPFWRKDSS